MFLLRAAIAAETVVGLRVEERGRGARGKKRKKRIGLLGNANVWDVVRRRRFVRQQNPECVDHRAVKRTETAKDRRDRGDRNEADDERSKCFHVAQDFSPALSSALTVLPL